MPDTFAEQRKAVSDHQQAADELAAKVLKRAEAGGFAIASEVRREALALMGRLVRQDPSPDRLLYAFLTDFRKILYRYEPVLARTYTDSQLAAFLEGGRGVLRSLPMAAPLPTYLERNALIDPPEWSRLVTAPGDAEPIVHFPIIEAAAADMAERGILSPATLDAAHQIAREAGFLAGRKGALDAMERVRDALIEAVVDGDTFPEFHDKVGDALDASRLAPKAQEMLFRNVVMRAYARGQKAVVEHEAVRSVALWAWRSEINDSRLTPLCRALSHSGLMNVHGKRTSVYFIDDVIWPVVAPQSHPGCRCGVIFLTTKRAAQKGIVVAQKWLATGIRPPDDELFVPVPDLSMIPAHEQRQFASWVSPWASSFGGSISLSSKDAHGHLHKDKGKGGGQFTGPAENEGTPAQRVLAKIKSGEIFSTASLKNAAGGSGDERNEWLRQVADDLSFQFADGASTSEKIQAIQQRLTEKGMDPRHPGWHKAEQLINRVNEEYADGGGTELEILDTVQHAKNLTESMTAEQQAHVAKELGLSIQPPLGFPTKAYKFENGDFKEIPGSELTYAGTTAAGKEAFRDRAGQYYIRNSSMRVESVSSGFDPVRTISNPVNGQSVAEGIRERLRNARAEHEAAARQWRIRQQKLAGLAPGHQPTEQDRRQAHWDADNRMNRWQNEQRTREAHAKQLKDADWSVQVDSVAGESVFRARDADGLWVPGARGLNYDAVLYAAFQSLTQRRQQEEQNRQRAELARRNSLIVQDAVQPDRGVDVQEIGRWDFWDGHKGPFPNRVFLRAATFQPDEGDPFEVYRWESLQEGGGGEQKGQWIADRAKAIADGQLFAAASDMEPDAVEMPDDDNEDGTDVDDVDEIFGAKELGLRVERRGMVVRFYHPKIDECKRTLGVDSHGHKFIHNDIFKMVDDEQGRGFGPKVFAAQVKGAVAAGYDYIETHAARSDGTYNGYYTWVCLGYDQDLDVDISAGLARSIREIVPGAESVLDLMDAGNLELDEETVEDMREKINALADVAGSKEATKKIREKAKKSVFNGRDYWLAYGESLYHAKFDLSKGSRSRDVLKEYLSSKRR